MMHRLRFLACLLAVLAPAGLRAQILEPQKVFDNAEMSRALAADQAPVSKGVLLLLPTVPVTFSSLEKNDEGEWKLGSAITMGFGITFVVGKASLTGTTMTASPWLIAGAAINAGVQADANSNAVEALTLSGFVGFGDVALSFSRNLLRGGTSIGMSLKLDVLTNLAPSAYMCLAGGCRKGT